jgi:hypothetical protein
VAGAQGGYEVQVVEVVAELDPGLRVVEPAGDGAVADEPALVAVVLGLVGVDSEITALSSRDFRASSACWRATTDRQTATAAAAAAITAEMIARPIEPLSPTSMSSTPVGPRAYR